MSRGGKDSLGPCCATGVWWSSDQKPLPRTGGNANSQVPPGLLHRSVDGPVICVVTSFLRSGKYNLCVELLACRGRTKGKWLLGDLGPMSLEEMTPIGFGSVASPIRTSTGLDHMVVGHRVWTQGLASLLTSSGFPVSRRPV